MSNRADFLLTRTPLGAIVDTDDGEGRKWIFIGWRKNTAGYEMYFVRTLKASDRGEPYTYHASIADTLIRKFPALEEYRKQDDQG